MYFFDAMEDEIAPSRDYEQRYFFDPSDDVSESARLGKAFHLTLDYEFIRESQVDKFLDKLDGFELLGETEPFDTYAFGVRTAITLQAVSYTHLTLPTNREV